MPDRFASFGEGRFVVDTVLLNIRLADAPVLSAGDTVEIAGQLHEVRGTPTRDSDRLVWLAEARKNGQVALLLKTDKDGSTGSLPPADETIVSHRLTLLVYHGAR